MSDPASTPSKIEPTPEYTGPEPQVTRFHYTNHRGEQEWRRAIIKRIYVGSTEYHRRPQVLVDAWCLDRKAMRTFAMRDMVMREGDHVFRLETVGIGVPLSKPAPRLGDGEWRDPDNDTEEHY